jgi:hypothetical protein
MMSQMILCDHGISPDFRERLGKPSCDESLDAARSQKLTCRPQSSPGRAEGRVWGCLRSDRAAAPKTRKG